MTAYRAARAGTSGRVFGALVLVASLGLAGCSDVDEAMFGDDTDAAQASSTPGTLPSQQQQQASQQQASQQQGPQQQAQSAEPAPSAEPSQSGEPAPEAQPAPSENEPGTLPPQTNAAAPAAAPSAPVYVAPGANTGTVVSGTIANLRAELTGLEDHLASGTRQQAALHGQAAANATAYHQAKARIDARLQLGTTRANPELVAEWNNAQSALDQLTVDINSLNALGIGVAKDSAGARSLLDRIGETFNVSGAVDEDHRQLTVLEDETTQTVIRTDRLLKTISADVTRQAAYAGNERANLTALAGAIKNGELYGAGAPVQTSSAGTSYSGAPLVTIRFDRSNVDYQQILYAALNQALQSRPGAAFSVVAVSPARGTVAAVHSAQTAAKRHAQEVMRSISDMGVPASRLAVASSTDPNATSSEVRVFVR